MKKGGWVPIDKRLKKFFPNDRPYSVIEAMFSLTLDNDSGKKRSILYYSKLWLWDRKKVRKLVNLQGQPRDINLPTLGTVQGHPIRLINSGVGSYRVSSGSAQGQPRDNSGTPSSNPNPNPNPKIRKLESSKLLISHLDQSAIVEKVKRVKTLTCDPVDVELANLLVKHIQNNLPNFKVPALASWQNDFRLMREVDERKPEDIRKVIEFCQQDVFWMSNVLSAKKLRMQFDRLLLKVLVVTPAKVKKSKSELLRDRIKASESGEASVSDGHLLIEGKSE